MTPRVPPPKPGPAPRRKQPWSSHPNMWRDPATVRGEAKGCPLTALAGLGALGLAVIIQTIRSVTS